MQDAEAAQRSDKSGCMCKAQGLNLIARHE